MTSVLRRAVHAALAVNGLAATAPAPTPARRSLRAAVRGDRAPSPAAVRPDRVVVLGLPGVLVGTADEQVSDECRTDLLTVAGDPVAVRVVGTSADAVARRPLDVEPCGAERALTLADGERLDINPDNSWQVIYAV